MISLYEKLMYNWERGFYSVVKDKNGFYWIISTKKEDFGTGGFRRSISSNDIEECKLTVGDSALTGEQIGTCEEKCGWKIVDTIHPSELMGKGFQVGDKVIINLTGDSENGKEGLVESFLNDGMLINVRLGNGLLLEHLIHKNLKPVLPVEEKDNIVKNACGHLGLLYLDKRVDGYICHKCGEEIDNAIKLLKEKGIIKDGHIVNL